MITYGSMQVPGIPNTFLSLHDAIKKWDNEQQYSPGVLSVDESCQGEVKARV